MYKLFKFLYFHVKKKSTKHVYYKINHFVYIKLINYVYIKRQNTKQLSIKYVYDKLH